MDEEELVPGKGYLLQIGTQKIPAVVTEIRHKIDIHTGETLKAARIQKNELARGERKLALFGAGLRCGFYLDMMYEDVNIIIDNDSSKWGTWRDWVKVCSVDEIQDWGQYFVIVTVLSTAKIEEQLQQLGLKRDVDFLIGNEYNM